MDIDVIIPVFNGAEFVRRAVESALGQQTGAALTIHCIDDQSTDRSWAVMQDLAREYETVRSYRNARNVGVAATRNWGVTQGVGEFIAFLDQDDVWVPHKAALQLTAFEQDPAVAYVVGRQKIVVEDGHRRPAWCRPEWLESTQLGFLPSALMVRREAFAAVGFFDESMRAGGDDSDWFARARRAGVPFANLDEVLLERHVHDHNLSSDRSTDNELLTMVRRHVTESRGAEHP